jgi:hypothetical protein
LILALEAVQKQSLSLLLAQTDARLSDIRILAIAETGKYVGFQIGYNLHEYPRTMYVHIADKVYHRDILLIFGEPEVSRKPRKLDAGF